MRFHLLDQHWYPVATSSELSTRPLAVSLFNKRIVLFRNADNCAVALLDLCPHRNAPLSLGSVENGKLQCAYHGWTFGAEGKILGIPALVDQEKLPPKCVQSFKVHESEETVWVNIQPEVSMTPAWGALDGHSTYFEIVTKLKAPMDLIIENFVDCAHTPFVHKGLFRSPDVQLVEAVIKNTPTGVHIETLGEKNQKSLLGKLFMGAETTVHTDEFIFPTTVKVDYSWGTKKQIRTISICTPMDDDNTRITTRVYIKGFMFSGIMAIFLKGLTKKILAQDKVILAGQAEAIKHQGDVKFMGVSSDGPIAFVRKAYFDYAAGTRVVKNDRESRVKYRI